MKINSSGNKYLVLGALLALTVLIRFPLFMEPWGGDQAGYGFVAKGILEGKVPFKDIYSLTAYGIFFTFAFFFKLFGMSMISIHIGHIIATLITVTLVYFLTYRLFGKTAAIIAALCYTIFSSGLAFSGFGYENKSAWGTYWYLSQREVFMAPLILGAVYLTIISEKKKKYYLYLLSGVLVGLAAFYKLTSILMLILLIYFTAGEEIIQRNRFHFGKTLRRVFLLISGFVLIQLPFLYYFWVHDALKDMYQALFVHLKVYAKLSRGLRIEALFSGHYSVLKEDLLLWLFAFISILYMFFKDRTRNNILVASWALCSLLMVWGQGKFFGYHFLILVPPFAILTGYGMLKFIRGGPGVKKILVYNLGTMTRTFLLTTTTLCLIAILISNYDYYKRHVTYLLGKMTKQEYYEVFQEFPTHPYSFHSDYQVVNYLKEKARNDDKLGVVFSAGDSVIHFLTGLQPATRFLQSWYLFSSDEELCTHEITVKLRGEFIEQLTANAPRFILCVHIPIEELFVTPCLLKDKHVVKLHEFIKNNYNVKDFPDNRYLFEKI
jgi:hypothetical protein